MLPKAEHVQPSGPHLLNELRALMRQRRGQALLGCRLCLSARLGARPVHLGRTARSARRGTLWATLAVSAKLTTTCPMLPSCMAVYRGPVCQSCG